MDFKSHSHNQPGFHANRCMVCDSPLVLNPLKPDSPRICSDVQCQTLYKQRSEMNPVLYNQHFQRQQQLIVQKKFAEIEKQKHIERIKDAEFAENEYLVQRVIDQEPDLAGAKIKVTQIPSGLQVTKPLEDERIEEYMSHIQTVVTRAEEVEDISELLDDQLVGTHECLLQQDQRISSNAALEAEVGKLCSLCKGGCCAAGGNHAYIHAVTIRRLMDAHAMSSEELQAFYRDQLPEVSVVGSCINQTDSGCSLPRMYRSDVCNLYLCGAMEEHLQWTESNGSNVEKNLVVQRENTNWNRFEAVEKNSVVNMYLENEKGELVTLALNNLTINSV